MGTHLSVGTLDQFDEDDSSVATTLMDGYYGLAGTWLGLSVGDPSPTLQALQQEAAFSACDSACDALRIRAPTRLH